MKKLLLILSLVFLLSSCNKYIVTNVYEQKYTDKELAVSDVYTQLEYYDVDSIPLENWMYNKMLYDTIVIEQSSMRKAINEKSTYTFIFSTYTYPSLFYHSFLIRFSGKEKDLKR